MNPPVCLTDIPFKLDIPALLKKLRIDGHPEYEGRAARLAEEAVPLARPKAMYTVSYIDAKGEDTVVVDGVTLTSRVLRVNLEHVHRVFPFVVTCGMELAEWSKPITDMLERFWADEIMEAALRSAFDALGEHLANTHDLGHTASMNPGSLKDWPLEQQPLLFKLLGDVPERVGVRLTESLIMVPVKSVSGLRFPTESSFENCQLCPRDRCPGRRAPYDPNLYHARYSARA